MTLHPGEFVVDPKMLVAEAFGATVKTIDSKGIIRYRERVSSVQKTPKGKCRSCGSFHYTNGVCAYCRTPA